MCVEDAANTAVLLGGTKIPCLAEIYLAFPIRYFHSTVTDAFLPIVIGENAALTKCTVVFSEPSPELGPSISKKYTAPPARVMASMAFIEPGKSFVSKIGTAVPEASWCVGPTMPTRLLRWLLPPRIRQSYTAKEPSVQKGPGGEGVLSAVLSATVLTMAIPVRVVAVVVDVVNVD